MNAFDIFCNNGLVHHHHHYLLFDQTKILLHLDIIILLSDLIISITLSLFFPLKHQTSSLLYLSNEFHVVTIFVFCFFLFCFHQNQCLFFLSMNEREKTMTNRGFSNTKNRLYLIISIRTKIKRKFVQIQTLRRKIIRIFGEIPNQILYLMASNTRISRNSNDNDNDGVTPLIASFSLSFSECVSIFISKNHYFFCFFFGLFFQFPGCPDLYVIRIYCHSIKSNQINQMTHTHNIIS